MKFIDRTRELKTLDELRNRPDPQFVVVYGRRRIGKTALITRWLEGGGSGQSVYWVAHKSSPALLLEKFSLVLGRSLAAVPEGVRFADWEAALRQVFELACAERIVLAIDEFPYLLESYPEVASLLQILWDEYARRSQIMLVLCGSYYPMMRQVFTSGEGPLYGRSTADLLLGEIEPDSIRKFLPRYSSTQVVETYSIVGGVPKYLEMWDDQKSVLANVEQLLLSPVTIFRQEAIFLIQDEIAEPRTYLAILEAIGAGAKTPGDIAKQSGIVQNHVGKYLSVLVDLGFVRRLVSLEAKTPSRSRLGHYEIRDPYLRFFFTYIYSNLELIEQNRLERLVEIVRGQQAAYVARTGYEELCRRKIIQLGDAEQLSFAPQRVGRIWSRTMEVDIAAVNHTDKVALLGECKWTGKPVAERVFDELVEKARDLDKLQEYHFHYALFSKSGFTAKMIERARQDHVMLFTGPDLEPVEG